MSQSLKNLGSKLDDLSRADRVLVNEGADVIVLSSLSAADATEITALAAEAQLTWHGEHAADGALSKDEGFDSALERKRQAYPV